VTWQHILAAAGLILFAAFVISIAWLAILDRAEQRRLHGKRLDISQAMKRDKQ
jgi:hypothetical protein